MSKLELQSEASDHVLTYENVDDADDRRGRHNGGDQHRGGDVPGPRARHGLPRGPMRVRHGVGISRFSVAGAKVRQTGVKSRSRFGEAFRSLLNRGNAPNQALEDPLRSGNHSGCAKPLYTRSMMSIGQPLWDDIKILGYVS